MAVVAKTEYRLIIYLTFSEPFLILMESLPELIKIAHDVCVLERGKSLPAFMARKSSYALHKHMMHFIVYIN